VPLPPTISTADTAVEFVQALLEEECPAASSANAATGNVWLQLELLAAASLEEYFAGGVIDAQVPQLQQQRHLQRQRLALALASLLRGLAVLMSRPAAALLCPVLCVTHLQRAAEWATALDQPQRARGLLQLGGAFKLEAMWRWISASRRDPSFAQANPRFHPRLHAQYTIAMQQLHSVLEVKHKPLLQWRGPQPPDVEIHSLCHYPSGGALEGQSRNTLTLPALSVPNHKAYAAKHGHRYVLHERLPKPELEPQFNKINVVAEALGKPGTAQWILFIDCDAFFTNFSTSVADVFETYGASSKKTQFLVAEDPGGINTGVFLIRNSAWSKEFLGRVDRNGFRMAWDQSMFLWEMLGPELFDEHDVFRGDFALKPEVVLVHQAHLNAFVPPASHDWQAYEWQRGDFICHFAGCPFREPECEMMIMQAAQSAADEWIVNASLQ